MRVALVISALAAALAVAPASHAADQAVTAAGLQFVPSGWVAPAPVVAGTAQEVVPLVPSFRKGDRVVFTNLDPLPHQVFRISGPSSFAALPTMGSVGGLPGSTSSLSTGALAVGKYIYGCTFHPGMRGAFQLTA